MSPKIPLAVTTRCPLARATHEFFLLLTTPSLRQYHGKDKYRQHGDHEKSVRKETTAGL